MFEKQRILYIYVEVILVLLTCLDVNYIVECELTPGWGFLYVLRKKATICSLVSSSG